MNKITKYVKAILGLCLLFALWWLLAAETSFYVRVFIGIFSTGLVAILYRRFTLSIDIPVTTILKPLLWIKFLSYLVVRIVISTGLTCYLILTNNTHPKIVAYETKLDTRSGLLFLCNSITLTPTTITIFHENDLVYIHHLYLETEEDYERLVDRIHSWFEKPLQNLIG